jgi:uncharacterized membrane protein YfcA
VSPYELGGAVLAGALAAAVGTPAGVSGGLLLLPLLLTGYGLAGTVASATNLVFNIISTPAGLLRQARRGRLDPGLTRLLVGTAVPGAVVGVLANVFLLGDSPAFRGLVAGLLVAVAASLLIPGRPAGTASAVLPTDTSGMDPADDAPRPDPADDAPRPDPAVGTPDPATASGARGPETPGNGHDRAVARLTGDRRRVLAVVGAASGVLGGFYGLGGAVLAAPAALLLTRWPVARVSGAALVTTLAVSVTGLATYVLLDVAGQTSVDTPHWPLGIALGLGGTVGAYLAARFAGRLPDRLLRSGLAVIVALGAARLALG